MANFKTYLRTLLNTFGLDYEHAQTIPLVHTSSGLQTTEFIPPCDGYLVCSTQASSTQMYLGNVTIGANVFSIKSENSPTWLANSAIVKKGNTYQCCVTWANTNTGNSRMIFYPFTFSRQSSN